MIVQKSFGSLDSFAFSFSMHFCLRTALDLFTMVLYSLPVNFINFTFSSLLLSLCRLLTRLIAFILSLHSVSYHSLYLHDFVEFILLYDLVFSMLQFFSTV